MDGPTLGDELLRLEAALAARDPDGVDGGLMDLIAEDFVDFGRSGRVWTRETVRTALEGPATRPVRMDEFTVTRMGEAVALVTYRTTGSLRSSIRVHEPGRWRLRFHQGTPSEE